MKKIKSFDILSILLLVLAAIFGGNVAMAAAGAPDPQNPSPDTKGLETELGGTGASATLTNNSMIAAREIDKQMILLSPYKLPELNVKVLAARQVNVTKYDIEYPISGATPLDFEIDYAVSASAHTSRVQLHAHNGTPSSGYEISEDAFRGLQETTTLILEGVPGYRIPEDGTTTPIEDGDLEVQVMIHDDANNAVTLEAVNGWEYYNGKWQSVMPTSIAAGTPIHIMATACSESQREVAPENFLPVTKHVTLQKQVSNMVLTDDFLNQIKEIEFGEKELAERVEYNHLRKAARTFWLGAEGKKRVKPGKHMSEEDVFFSRGVLRQILNKYAVDGELTFEDLNNICDIQFGVNSLSEEATVFVGNKFNLKLMNLLTKNQRSDITLVSKFDDNIKVGFKSYELNAVGTLNFVHSRTLDDIGYGECAVVLDTKNMTRYVKFDLKQAEVDMKQGGGPEGETREAKRKIYTCADAVSLRSCNSILIGPSKKIFNMYSDNDNDNDILIFNATVAAAATDGLDVDTSNTDSAFYASSSSTTLAPFKAKVDAAGNVMDGTKVYLATDDPFTGRSAGVILIWSVADAEWKLYTGPITYEKEA